MTLRVGVLGGGPGGLYFALLLRQALPDAEVTVVERNRADDTYGFGVVFSDETLGAFRDADPPSYAAIAARFRRWEAIETFYRRTCTVSRGHGFAALSRGVLLALLQERCREASAWRSSSSARRARSPSSPTRLQMATTSSSPPTAPTAWRGASLAAALAPRVEQGGARFCWLGTTRPLDAFTFLFAETPHGLFQVHAYPYDDGMATWIVECTEATWRAAGLLDADEARTVAFCAEIFGDFLAGHRLVANRSIWRTFPTVACERWSAEVAPAARGRSVPVVLIGDAVHTAHFSIGSGTKLAMEDAIALVAALRHHADGGRGGRPTADSPISPSASRAGSAPASRHAADLRSALAAYEESRRVEVAKLQKAAKTSREWFEACAAGRYLGQHPLQLTFNMMTRSKRITYDNLRERDPALVEAVNHLYARTSGTPVDLRWNGPEDDCLGPESVVRVVPEEADAASAMGRAPSRAQPSAATTDGIPTGWRGPRDVLTDASPSPAPPDPTTLKPPPVFVPFRVRSLELANRIVVSPMCQYSAVDGTADDWHLVHLGSRALGGAGLVIAEMTDVEAEGRITLGCAGMYERAHVAAWRRIVDFVHARSAAKIGLQIAHAGRKGSTRHPWEGDSDYPLTAADGAWQTIAPSPLPFKPDWPAPREMTAADLDRVRAAFARAAQWADEAGFDWLEIHMAHGYLLSSFLSPLVNVRSDDFGGSLENRMRWPLRGVRRGARRLAGAQADLGAPHGLRLDARRQRHDPRRRRRRRARAAPARLRLDRRLLGRQLAAVADRLRPHVPGAVRRPDPP